MEGNAAILAGLESRLEYCRTVLERISNEVKSATLVDVDVHLRACHRQEAIFEKLCEEIFTINAKVKKEEKLSTKPFGLISTFIQAIDKKAAKIKKAEGDSHKSEQPRSSSKDFVSLPKIKLPHWDGDVAAWTGFISQFRALIHGRTDIDDVIKFQYLRSTLKNEPLAIVDQYPIDSGSYELAYKDLVERYENKRRLASYFIHQIISYKTTTHGGHVKFSEVHRSAYHSLLALRIENLSDFILFELAYNNLHVREQREFDQSFQSSSVPSIKDLIKFVEKFARSEELHADKKEKSPVVRRSFSTATKSIEPSCYLCKGKHKLFTCDEFTKLSARQRQSKVAEMGCCTACLYKHPNRECKSTFSCKKCGSKKHNTMLHEGESPESPPSGQVFSGACQNTKTALSLSAVLLGTIECSISDQWGKPHKIRALLDPGSEVSIITKTLVQRLGIKSNPENCIVQGVSEAGTKALGTTSFNITSVSTGFAYPVSAVVLPRICAELPTAKIPSSVRDRFSNIRLADPSFDEPREVDVLLGAEAYTELLSPQQPTVISGSPSAINTKMGYVLIGKLDEAKNQTPASTYKAFFTKANSSLESALTRLSPTEEAIINEHIDPEDQEGEKHFVKNHSRDHTGRFAVRLPFLPIASSIGNNILTAKSSINRLERRLRKNPETAAMYQACLQECLDLGHKQELEEVLYHVIRTNQSAHRDQLLKLESLSPFMGKERQVIRVGGRLGNVDLPDFTRHPILIPKQSNQISNQINQIIIKQHHRMANCSLEFGGPFIKRESRLRKSRQHKAYICIFVCLIIRAAHLEMATDLSAGAFEAALQRFIARRGAPDTMYSDNGTNFVAVRNTLVEAQTFLRENENQILAIAAASGCEWKFSPPSAPNFNGCAENGIKSTKALLKRQVGAQILTFEEFGTLLCRVEAVLNSRPIQFSSDVSDQEVSFLTPGHFIIGAALSLVAEKPTNDGITYHDKWKRMRQISDQFWKKWSTAYLHQLMTRNKWTKGGDGVTLGDIVWIKQEDTTPLSWPIGRVEAVIVGQDGIVRVVRLRCRGKALVRPVSKLIKIIV